LTLAGRRQGRGKMDIEVTDGGELRIRKTNPPGHVEIRVAKQWGEKE